MAGGVAFCCPASCPSSCSMSSSQTDDVLTATCTCRGGLAEEVEASPHGVLAWAAAGGIVSLVVGGIVMRLRAWRGEVLLPAEVLG